MRLERAELGSSDGRWGAPGGEVAGVGCGDGSGMSMSMGAGAGVGFGYRARHWFGFRIVTATVREAAGIETLGYACT